jgi:transposase
MAGIRGKAAALVAGSGFMERVRELLKTAPAVHADETPARAAGGLRYVHLACTAYLTLMHTGDRSAEAIDAGGVLPGYCGIIVRDGYASYSHLTDALHAEQASAPASFILVFGRVGFLPRRTGRP